VRLFIAINIPAAIKTALQAAIAETMRAARAVNAEIKWVDPVQYHFTLKFLGNCDEIQLPGIVEAARSVAGRTQRFQVALRGLGGFPEKGSLKIIWAGIGEGQAPIIQLAGNLELALAPLGFLREERPYNPHLTIARVRTSKNAAGFRQLFNIDLPPLAWQATSADLMRSTLSSAGPTYSLVQSFPFSA
jgi:2'-5' RNA ligase